MELNPEQFLHEDIDIWSIAESMTSDLFKLKREKPIEEIAKIYRNIEKGKNEYSPIRIRCSHNAVPATQNGPCHSLLVGIMIDKRDFKERMPLILNSLLNCKSKNRYVLLIVDYWDGLEWENKWKGSFKAVSAEVKNEVYRLFLDGEGRLDRLI